MGEEDEGDSSKGQRDMKNPMVEETEDLKDHYAL